MVKIPDSIFAQPERLANYFNPDTIQSPIIGISAYYGKKNVHSPRAKMHSHQKGQLVYTRFGSVTVELMEHSCVVSPYQAAWIPPLVLHNTILNGEVDFRAIYFDYSQLSELPLNFDTFLISPLLKEVLEVVSATPFNTDWRQGPKYHLCKVLFDELKGSAHGLSILPLPRDTRVRPYLLKKIRNGEQPPRLKELASHVGASERTIHRLFMQETGVNYQKWRQIRRLARAIELLSTGKSITETAQQLEFSSDSAFISFFRSYLDKTPKKYVNLMKNNLHL
ncbi:AraC family transcriptional regulator [Zooshikella sp. RANM57]|uniref:helix-turn-helix transcriptional regulator n=1 Tax=Zooshikella sp. RANM57 TaxID=3425863 RepID=UPI003D6E2AFB